MLGLENSALIPIYLIKFDGKWVSFTFECGQSLNFTMISKQHFPKLTKTVSTAKHTHRFKYNVVKLN